MLHKSAGFQSLICTKLYDLWDCDFPYDFQALFVAKSYGASDLLALCERELSMLQASHEFIRLMGYGFMLFKRRCTDKTCILLKTFMSGPQNFV